MMQEEEEEKEGKGIHNNPNYQCAALVFTLEAYGRLVGISTHFQTIELLVCVGLCVSVSASGGVFCLSSISWF